MPAVRPSSRVEPPPTGPAGAEPWRGADVLGVAVAAGDPAQPDAFATRAAARYRVDLAAVLAAEKVSGRAGEVVRVPVQAGEGLPARWLLVGTGLGTPQDLRRAGAALARACRGRRHLVTSIGAGRGDDATRAVVEGLVLGGYVPPFAGVSDQSAGAPVERVVLAGRHRDGAVHKGWVLAGATVRARDLAAMPSNVKSPQWMVDQAEAAAREQGLAVEVWDERRLAIEGFGGVVAVGSASATPPRMVRLDYRPGGTPPGRAPVVLIGKGVTYDTGGLSIKPRAAMVPMKTDMAGAGVVLAVLRACRGLGVRRPVVGLLPLAENAVGSASYRPGDVVRQYGGRTVEIANTDAEGRLVLADALAYAHAELDPHVLVDIATLTGAASLGLGRRHAALYTSRDALADALRTAAQACGEGVWRMPLVEDYRPLLDSSIADVRHVPEAAGVGGGSITAALFLREFTAGRPWAHLDVAGPARADRDEHEVNKGATGFGARLLLRWLEGMR